MCIRDSNKTLSQIQEFLQRIKKDILLIIDDLISNGYIELLPDTFDKSLQNLNIKLRMLIECLENKEPLLHPITKKQKYLVEELRKSAISLKQVMRHILNVEALI